MTDLYVTITGDRDVALRFERLSESLRTRLVRTIGELGEQIVQRQRAAAPRRTGRLARELGQTTIRQGEGFVRATVGVAAASGIEAAKIGALEYGAPGRRGRFTVRAHQRRHRGIDQVVHRYTRTARLREGLFIRGPFRAMQQQIEDEIRNAVLAALAEGE
jgi:hypothetical protein